MSKKRSKASLNALQDEIIDLCAFYGIKPSHAKGQNFLVNEAVYEAIVKAAGIKADDIVVEVGPGLGYLTAALAKEAKQVIAVELDRHLSEILVNRFRGMGMANIQVINGDILRWPHLTGLAQPPSNYKIVSNLPYNITSFFLRQFLSIHQDRPQTMTLMLQDEVAKRLCSRAGEMSLLGLSAQFYAQVEYLFPVPPQDFWPAPKVNSAVVHFQLKSSLPLSPAEEKLFFRLARIGFSAKRKMLKKNIMTGVEVSSTDLQAIMTKCQLDWSLRAQDLTLDDWLKLFGYLKDFMV